MTSAGGARAFWKRLGWNVPEAIGLAIGGVLLWGVLGVNWHRLLGIGRHAEEAGLWAPVGSTGVQLTGYWCGLAAAVLLITLKASGTLRDRTVRARERRQTASWRTVVLVVGALAAAFASLFSAAAASYALTALAVGLVIGGAEHLGKSAFRRMTVIVVLAGLLALAAAGHRAIVADAEDAERKAAAEREAAAASAAATPTPEATATETAERTSLTTVTTDATEVATTRESTQTGTSVTVTRDTEQTTEITEVREPTEPPAPAPTPTPTPTPTPRPAVEVVQLVQDGLDHTLATVHEDLGGDDPEPAFGPWGYLLIGLLLLVAYRWLEVRNNQQYGAPIEVVEIAGLGEDVRGPLTQRLRERILDSGISDPGPIPGVTTGTELSKLLAEADVPHNAVAAAALTVIQTVAFPPAGIKVVVTVTERAEDTWEASVELSTRAEGRYVESRTLTAEDPTALVDAVAGFVATNALNYSRATPPWAKWHDTTGQSLLNYQRIQDDRAGPRPALSMEEARTELEAALRASPGNALVRLALGHQYDLEGQRLQALHLHLLTCTDYPTMLNSRYRLATSLLMTSDPAHLNRHWLPGTPLRATVITLLCERHPDGSGIETTVSDLRGALESPQPTVVSHALRELAVIELDELKAMLSPRTLLWLAGRPAERAVTLAVLRDRVERTRRKSTYATVRILIRVRLALADGAGANPGDPPVPDLVRDLKKLREELDEHAAWSSSSSPTAHYNAACVHGELARQSSHPSVRASLLSDPSTPATESDAPSAAQTPTPSSPPLAPAPPSDLDEGFRHLEEALRRGGRALFAREWLERDPDLAPLRSEKDRFEAVLNTLTTPGPPEQAALEGTP